MRKKWESCVRKDLTTHRRNLWNTIAAKGPTEKTKGQQDNIGTGKEFTTAAIRADQHAILRGKTGVVPLKISAAMISTNGIYNSAPFLFKVYTYIPPILLELRFSLLLLLFLFSINVPGKAAHVFTAIQKARTRSANRSVAPLMLYRDCLCQGRACSG